MNTTQRVRRLHPTGEPVPSIQSQPVLALRSWGILPKITRRGRVLLELTQVGFVLEERLQPSGVGRNAP